MQIYLPIAGLSIDVFLLLGLGGIVGLLSGMFGVGGGFLMTPLLVLVGVPPAIAAASVANQVVGASISGTLAQCERGNVDFRMGAVLVAGGVVGSALGVWIFTLLKAAGQIDVALSLCYVTLLGTLGVLMVAESARAWLRRRNPLRPRRKLHAHSWIHGLPMKMKFRASRLYISVFAPGSIGLGVGVLSGVMGVGGGFVMVPALIYLLDMPTAMAVGTSLLQITVVSAGVTVMQSVGNHSVDALLALVLVIGGAAGAQIGGQIGARLQGEYIRGLLGLIILAVAIQVGAELAIPPVQPYELAP